MHIRIGECYLAAVDGRTVPVRALRRAVRFRQDSRGRVFEDILFECKNLETGRIVRRRASALQPLSPEDERRFAHLISHIR